MRLALLVEEMNFAAATGGGTQRASGTHSANSAGATHSANSAGGVQLQRLGGGQC